MFSQSVCGNAVWKRQNVNVLLLTNLCFLFNLLSFACVALCRSFSFFKCSFNVRFSFFKACICLWSLSWASTNRSILRDWDWLRACKSRFLPWISTFCSRDTSSCFRVSPWARFSSSYRPRRARSTTLKSSSLSIWLGIQSLGLKERVVFVPRHLITTRTCRNGSRCWVLPFWLVWQKWKSFNAC